MFCRRDRGAECACRGIQAEVPPCHRKSDSLVIINLPSLFALPPTHMKTTCHIPALAWTQPNKLALARSDTFQRRDLCCSCKQQRHTGATLVNSILVLQ